MAGNKHTPLLPMACGERCESGILMYGCNKRGYWLEWSGFMDKHHGKAGDTQLNKLTWVQMMRFNGEILVHT